MASPPNWMAWTRAYRPVASIASTWLVLFRMFHSGSVSYRAVWVRSTRASRPSAELKAKICATTVPW